VEGLEAGADGYLFSTATPSEINAIVKVHQRAKQRIDRLHRATEIARDLADKDHLTGLYNRRFFDAGLSDLLRRCESQQLPLSVLTLDIDHFKKINDRLGHGVGDDVLREVARRIEGNVRVSDIACRVGGEEFIVIMPGTELDKARRVGERLRLQFSRKPIRTSAMSEPVKLTVSIGVTGYDRLTDSLDQLLRRADKALYDAKAQGRNRVICSIA
jgi:two-component system cell cycle response regulator